MSFNRHRWPLISNSLSPFRSSRRVTFRPHLDVQGAVLVVENQGDFGDADRLALGAPTKNDLLRIGGAELARVGLAESPEDGIDDVGFTASVRPHNGN